MGMGSRSGIGNLGAKHFDLFSLLISETESQFDVLGSFLPLLVTFVGMRHNM